MQQLAAIFLTSDKPHYPYELPKGWVWCKLDDIVVFQGGYAYKSNTYVNQSMWQVIRIGNVKNDSLNLKIQPVFVDEKTGKETQKYQLHKDDILFTMTGTKGKRDYFYSVKVQTIEKKLLLNQRVGCLRLFTPYINVDFLCLSLKCQYILDAIFSTETGNVSQGNIGSESTLNLKIAIPPFAEQCRIVTEVNKWYMAIEQLEQEKDKLQSSIDQVKSKVLDLAIHGKLVPQDPNDEPAIELLKRINPKAEIITDNGHYQKLPEGWCMTALCNISTILNGYAFKSSEYVSSDGIRIIRIANVQDGYIEDKLPQYYPKTKSSNIGQFLLKYNDLLMSLTGNVGRVGMLPKSLLPAALNQRVACIRENNLAVNKYYLFYLFQSNNFCSECIKSAKGVAQLNISTEWLKSYSILLPPITEQKRIVGKIEEIFAQLDAIETAL